MPRPARRIGTKREFLAGQDLGPGDGNRGFDLDFLQRQVARDFISHQHRDFGNQLAKFLGGRPLVAHQGNLVLDQWMVKDKYIIHEEPPMLVIDCYCYYEIVLLQSR